MKEVFRNSDAGLVSLYQSVLENAGLCTFVRNAETQQALVLGIITAILPLPDFWPTLCVMDDEDHPAAMEILRNVKHSAAAGGLDWKCPKCGESIPQSLMECWNCAAPSPA